MSAPSAQLRFSFPLSGAVHRHWRMEAWYVLHAPCGLRLITTPHRGRKWFLRSKEGNSWWEICTFGFGESSLDVDAAAGAHPTPAGRHICPRPQASLHASEETTNSSVAAVLALREVHSCAKSLTRFRRVVQRAAYTRTDTQLLGATGSFMLAFFLSKDASFLASRTRFHEFRISIRRPSVTPSLSGWVQGACVGFPLVRLGGFGRVAGRFQRNEWFRAWTGAGWKGGKDVQLTIGPLPCSGTEQANGGKEATQTASLTEGGA